MRGANFGLLLLVAGVQTSCGGSQGVVVATYPTYAVTATVSEPLAEVNSEDGQGYERYWSTDTYLEAQDVSRLWKAESLDYILITAKARLPTHSSPLVREFPLYTYEKGVVQSHAGVDLLQKFPIVIGQRNELSITLEVTHFNDSETLNTARTVLEQTSKLAAPYLDNYPVASQIVGGATSIIDALTPTDERRKNSFTTSIPATDIVQDTGLSKVFLLVPLDKAKNESSTLNGAPSVEGYSYSTEFVRCCDKPEAICAVSPAAKKSIDEQRAALLKSTKALKQAQENLEKAQRTSNAQANELDKLRQYTVRPPDGRDKSAEPSREYKAAEEQFLKAVELEQKAADEVKKYSAEVASFPRDKLHCQGPTQINYREARLRNVVYVAMHFLPSAHVYDRMALFTTDGCAISDSEIQRARDYVTTNEYLFYPQDVAMAYSAYRGATTLLTARALNAKGAVGDLVQLLADSDVPSDMGSRALRSAPLAQQSDRINQCLLRELRGSSPSREAWDVVQVHRHPSMTCEDTIGPGPACRLDLIGFTLTRLADTSARKYSVDKEDAWQGERSSIITALHGEAVRLAAAQSADTVAATQTCADEKQLFNALSRTSIYCAACLKRIQEACKSVPGVVETIAGARAQRESLLPFILRESGSMPP